MTRHIFIFIFICLLMACSCRKEDAGNGERLPGGAVSVFTAASGDAGLQTATLLFWDEDEFTGKWLSDDRTVAASARPVYGGIVLSGEIDSYSYSGGVPFLTGVEYPENGSYLYATGYSPYDALSLAKEGDYTVLSVSTEAMDGKTDFLSCDGKSAHRGSDKDRFTDKSHELQFRHLTSRIRFVGIRDEVMWGITSVNNVNVTLTGIAPYGMYVPDSFTLKTGTVGEDWGGVQVGNEWRGSTYVAGSLQKVDNLNLEAGNRDYIPATDNGMELFSCYILSEKLPEGYDPFSQTQNVRDGKISLTMDISADFSWYYSDREPEPYGTQQWKGRTVTIDSHSGQYLYPGYEYTVYIKFRREEVMLQGIQSEWEDGGTHYLPVYPEKE